MGHADYCAQFMPAGGRVLDVGSGRGKFLVDVARLGFQVFGLESSADYVKITQEAARASGQIVDVALGRAEALPFADDGFDFVNCAEASEHVDDPIRMCREIYRILKFGGHAYISFHNRYGFYDYHFALPFINWLPRAVGEKIIKWLGREKNDSVEIGRQSLAGMHYFTYRKIVRMLADMGFRVDDIRARRINELPRFLVWPIRLIYLFLARPLYFNTFHLLLTKPFKI